MPATDFSNMALSKKTAFQKEVLRMARDKSFIDNFSGGNDNVVHICTELSKTSKGTEDASIRLVSEYGDDGIAGDNEAEGNEGMFDIFEQLIDFDQLRFPAKNKGRLADQKSVDNFREIALNQLSYALANRKDQMAALTLSGISYTKNTDGSTRSATSQLQQLSFASKVTAPTSNRHFRWVDSSSSLAAGNTAAVVATDTPSYKMIIKIKAKFNTQYMRAVSGKAGSEVIHIFMHPDSIAALKVDPDFLANLRSAGTRGDKNSLFSGSMMMQDGTQIHDWRLVYNTTGLTSGIDKWGSGANVEGSRTLVCGAQALGMAQLGKPIWEEKSFDFGNSDGILVGQQFGLLKPVFNSGHTGQDEDFGVICLDHAI